MDDDRIIALYWSRDEGAIAATGEKYGRYCHAVAYNILRSDGDAEECVSDTYVKAWEAIPPTRPTRLKAFLARITRNLALNRCERSRAEKRGGESELCLDEFLECLPSPDTPIDESLALKEAINAFLAKLPKRTRTVFVMRYWYFASVKEIARAHLMRESTVKVTLMRARDALREHLIKEELFI